MYTVIYGRSKKSGLCHQMEKKICLNSAQPSTLLNILCCRKLCAARGDPKYIDDIEKDLHRQGSQAVRQSSAFLFN
jgi:hypothetical protein